jgi:hypothetical protein
MKRLKQNNLTKQNNFTPFSKRMKLINQNNLTKQNNFTKTDETVETK